MTFPEHVDTAAAVYFVVKDLGVGLFTALPEHRRALVRHMRDVADLVEEMTAHEERRLARLSREG